jgi:hypothetical protein
MIAALAIDSGGLQCNVTEKWRKARPRFRVSGAKNRLSATSTIQSRMLSFVYNDDFD